MREASHEHEPLRRLLDNPQSMLGLSNRFSPVWDVDKSGVQQCESMIAWMESHCGCGKSHKQDVPIAS
jgi:hypothetical protein